MSCLYTAKYDDGSMAGIHFEDNRFFIIVYRYGEDIGDDSIVKIDGFPSEKEAKNFLDFGDFFQDNNDFILITRPKYKLRWTCHKVIVSCKSSNDCSLVDFLENL